MKTKRQRMISVTMRQELSEELDIELSRLGLDKNEYLRRCLEISVKALRWYAPDCCDIRR